MQTNHSIQRHPTLAHKITNRFVSTCQRTFIMSETVGIRIPPKTPLDDRADLIVNFAKFSQRNKHLENDYSPEIYVWKAKDVTEILLHRITADRRMSDKEMSRLRNIAHKVAVSDDFILCSSECVRGLADDDLLCIKDPLIIDFHSFLFHHQSWTLTSLSKWDDTFDFETDDDELFCLVRDVNSPDLKQYNDEIKRLEGSDAFTLCTPAMEYDMNPKDWLDWRNYQCTPWPFDQEQDDVDIYHDKWSRTTPPIDNASDTYEALLRHMDDMNDYKNRLRREVGRLTRALEKANKRLRRFEADTNATETSSTDTNPTETSSPKRKR